jgi:hypothetical protein
MPASQRDSMCCMKNIFSILFFLFYISVAHADEGDYAGQEKITPSSQQGKAPYTATFVASKDPSISYVLNFGDGSKEGQLVCKGGVACSIVRVSHTYTNPGTYEVAYTRVYEDENGKISSKSLRGLAGRAFVQVDEVTKPSVPDLCKVWFNGCVPCTRSAPAAELSCPKKQCFGALLPRECRESFHVNKPPLVRVTGPTAVGEGFARKWKVTASDPEGDALAYAVLWGDEEDIGDDMRTPQKFFSQKVFTHTYDFPGTYTMTGFARDSNGGVGKKDFSVYVRDAYAGVTCTREYVPVCGEKKVCVGKSEKSHVCSPEITTYSNECSMHKGRAKKKHDGAC